MKEYLFLILIISFCSNSKLSRYIHHVCKENIHSFGSFLWSAPVQDRNGKRILLVFFILEKHNVFLILWVHTK